MCWVHLGDEEGMHLKVIRHLFHDYFHSMLSISFYVKSLPVVALGKAIYTKLTRDKTVLRPHHISLNYLMKNAI